MIDCATSKNMATANGADFDGYHDHHLSSKGIYSPAHGVQEKIIPHQRPQNERLEQCR